MKQITIYGDKMKSGDIFIDDGDEVYTIDEVFQSWTNNWNATLYDLNRKDRKKFIEFTKTFPYK